MSVDFSPKNLPLPIAIVNFGVTGKSIWKLLASTGLKSKDIAIFDENLKAAQTDGALYTSPQKLLAEFRPKTLVVSPGYPLATPWLQKFIADGGFVTTELEIAQSFLTSERVIAVTGSVGKSTSVSLLAAGLAAIHRPFFVGGNLGTPLAHYVLEVLAGSRERADWIVLELSSYQLECFTNLRAEISGVTSLTPNHLERYPTLEIYYQTKLKLFDHTEKFFVLNNPGGDLFRFLNDSVASQTIPRWEKMAGNKTKRKAIWVRLQDPEIIALGLDQAPLLGRHNQENLAFAAKIAELAGWPKSAVEAMKAFRGLSHRLEVLGQANGVTFVNDSKSTTIASVQLAIESALPKVPEGGCLHLLLGGRDKNLPWQDLASLAGQPKIRTHFFGECRSIAKKQSGLAGDEYKNLKDALPAVWKACRTGDLLLLSPGGTSLDEFKNFEERGRYFHQFFSEIGIEQERV